MEARAERASFVAVANGHFAESAKNYRGPVHVTLDFVIQRPKKHYRKVNTHLLSSRALPASSINGDLDNYVKFVLDALNRLAWYDDRQITVLHASKRWTNLHEAERTDMRITYTAN